MSKDPKEMSEEEIKERVITLGFRGDLKLFQTFCDHLKSELPDNTGVALRGSVITNERYEDGKPFDADGAGSSDLDVTLIGNQVMEYWDEDEFYIPKLHTKPLSDQTQEIAPVLNPLRLKLQQIVRRPVNFQATSNIILFAREVLMDQPYFIILEPAENQ
jgi:hypothetical protein